MGRGQGNMRIELPCKFGKLVCEVVRDDEDYREFAIDLHRSDGKAVQVCVVGTYESDTWEEPIGEDKIHVDLWDGEDEDGCGRHYVEPYGDGWWGEVE